MTQPGSGQEVDPVQLEHRLTEIEGAVKAVVISVDESVRAMRAVEQQVRAYNGLGRDTANALAGHMGQRSHSSDVEETVQRVRRAMDFATGASRLLLWIGGAVAVLLGVREAYQVFFG